MVKDCITHFVTEDQDPQHIASDKVAFAAQTKYKTLYSYVFNQVKDSVA